MAKFYYAVRVGKNQGIYETWDECKAQVFGFKGAVYKKFKTFEEAEAFINEGKTNAAVEEEELKDGELIAYVDGSYDIETERYSYGCVLIGKDFYEEHNEAFPKSDLSAMRNVAGEIEGAMFAIKKALSLSYEKLYLHYDYYGIEMWATKSWKANLKGTKAYQDFFEEQKDKINVEFIHVRAHTGIKYNERADELAKEAL